MWIVSCRTLPSQWSIWASCSQDWDRCTSDRVHDDPLFFASCLFVCESALPVPGECIHVLSPILEFSYLILRCALELSIISFPRSFSSAHLFPCIPLQALLSAIFTPLVWAKYDLVSLRIYRLFCCNYLSLSFSVERICDHGSLVTWFPIPKMSFSRSFMCRRDYVQRTIYSFEQRIVNP